MDIQRTLDTQYYDTQVGDLVMVIDPELKFSGSVPLILRLGCFCSLKHEMAKDGLNLGFVKG